MLVLSLAIPKKFNYCFQSNCMKSFLFVCFLNISEKSLLAIKVIDILFKGNLATYKQ